MKISHIKDLPAFLDHSIGEDIELHRRFSKPVSNGAKRFFFSLLETQNLGIQSTSFLRVSCI